MLAVHLMPSINHGNGRCGEGIIRKSFFYTNASLSGLFVIFCFFFSVLSSGISRNF